MSRRHISSNAFGFLSSCHFEAWEELISPAVGRVIFNDNSYIRPEGTSFYIGFYPESEALVDNVEYTFEQLEVLAEI